MDKTEIRPIEQMDDRAIAGVIRDVMTEFGATGEGYSIVDPEVDAMTAAYAGPKSAYFVALLDDVVVGGAGIGSLADGPPGVCEPPLVFWTRFPRTEAFEHVVLRLQ